MQQQSPGYGQPMPSMPVVHRPPPAMRMTRKVGAPLGALIAIALLAGLVLMLAGLLNPVLFGVGLIPTLVAFGIAVLAYLWLDRWEPEPLRLLIFAFCWGAGVAVLGSLLVGQVISWIGLSDPTLDVVLQAPFVEEFFKGLFLVLMLTGRRRAEMNSLTDFLVYAGFVGLGFAFVEDMLYLASAGSVGETLLLAALRLVLGVFAHPFFTSATAIGLYFAMRTSRVGLKILYGIAGYLGAVLLHAIWNGSSTFFGLLGYLVAYGIVLVPLFAGLVYLAVRSRNVEGTRVAQQVPHMVQQGLIHPGDAQWLASLPSRRVLYGQVKTAHGPKAVKQVRHFTDVVTELSFVRTRIAAGDPSAETLRDEAELVEAVRLERYHAAPFLTAVSQGAPRQPPGVGQPAPQPGRPQPADPRHQGAPPVWGASPPGWNAPPRHAVPYPPQPGVPAPGGTRPPEPYRPQRGTGPQQ
jgi:RsiW-degrading membrane proteinase PrsW (M82 family)